MEEKTSFLSGEVGNRTDCIRRIQWENQEMLNSIFCKVIWRISIFRDFVIFCQISMFLLIFEFFNGKILFQQPEDWNTKQINTENWMRKTKTLEKYSNLSKNCENLIFQDFDNFLSEFRSVRVHNWYPKSIEWLLLPANFTKIYKDAAKNAQVQN